MNNPVAKPGGRGYSAKQVRSWGLDKNDLPVWLKGLGGGTQQKDQRLHRDLAPLTLS